MFQGRALEQGVGVLEQGGLVPKIIIFIAQQLIIDNL